MLKHLSPMAAARFGHLPQEAADARSGEERPLKAGDATQVCRCPAAVRLAPGRGMAALRIYPDGRPGDTFYLDKPVELRPGTAFALLPLEETCTVWLSAPQPLETAAEPARAEPELIRPTIRVEQILTLFYQETEPGFFFPGEQHRPYELIYLDHGTLHNLVGGQDYVLRQNEALIVPPDRWHAQYGEAAEPAGFLTVSFTCAAPLPEAMLLRVLGQAQAAAEDMRALTAERERDLPYRDDLLIGTLQSLLARYARMAAEGGGGPVSPPATRRSENQILDHALRSVAESTHEKLTAQELARRCSVSQAYLSALFRRYLHTSPGAYIMRAKLEESRDLIRSGAGTMSQIAQQLCFSSVQHFSSAFRRHYGVPPSVYARSIRG